MARSQSPAFACGTQETFSEPSQKESMTEMKARKNSGNSLPSTVSATSSPGGPLPLACSFGKIDKSPKNADGTPDLHEFDDEEKRLVSETLKEDRPPRNVSEAEPAVSAYATAFAIGLYAACSSTLLVINKVAMAFVPDAPFILFCQFLASSLAVRALKLAKPDMDIEFLTWEKTKPFAVASLVFFICLLANTQALKSVNVETVIVARSCSPIAVAVVERITLGRELPSAKGIGALLLIVAGAVVYVLSDRGFQIQGYTWLAVYFVFIVLEMVFVKFVVDNVPMSTWTRVYYNNILSLPMAVVAAACARESPALTMQWTPQAVMVVLLSCAVGVAISYAGFNLRKLVSATSFTVVGVVCKIMTILINDTIWKKHSDAIGHAGLLICITAGFLYEKVKQR